MKLLDCLVFFGIYAEYLNVFANDHWHNHDEDCLNEYLENLLFNKRERCVYAIVNEERTSYYSGDDVWFKCPPGYHFQNSSRRIIWAHCFRTGNWSIHWPYCKEAECSNMVIDHGKVNDNRKKLKVGAGITVSCNNGYHLLGDAESYCMSSLTWSGNRACVKLTVYQEHCRELRKVVKWMHDVQGNAIPYCDFENNYLDPKWKLSSNIMHRKVPINLTVIVMVILFMFGFSLFLWQHFRKRRRGIEPTVRYHDEAIDLLLPSYEEAIKNTPNELPPRFEDLYNVDEQQSDNISFPNESRSYDDEATPPPYPGVNEQNILS